MSESEKKNDTLIETLTDAEQLHANAQQQLQDLGKQVQSNRDQARLMRELVQTIPLKPEVKENIEVVWRRQNDATRTMIHELREMQGAYGISANSTAYSTTSTAMQAFTFGGTRPFPGLMEITQRVNALIERDPLLEKVRAGLRRCGLDHGQPGKRSALDLVEDAERAISAPGPYTSPTATLVPLRQAIGRAILDVFGRCQEQEEGKNWSAKMLSIGRRCGNVNVPADHFNRLASTVEAMVNELSGGKDLAMERDPVLLKYKEGLSFLLTFLDGVDEGRLRS